MRRMKAGGGDVEILNYIARTCTALYRFCALLLPFLPQTLDITLIFHNHKRRPFIISVKYYNYNPSTQRPAPSFPSSPIPYSHPILSPCHANRTHPYSQKQRPLNLLLLFVFLRSSSYSLHRFPPQDMPYIISMPDPTPTRKKTNQG